MPSNRVEIGMYAVPNGEKEFPPSKWWVVTDNDTLDYFVKNSSDYEFLTEEEWELRKLQFQGSKP